MNETPSKRRRWISQMLVILAALVIFVVTVLVLQVDDWSRDLNTNSAETDVESRDPMLKPRETDLDLNATEDLVRRAAQRLESWEFQKRAEPLAEQGGLELHFTRSTLVFRFVDDIHVNLVPLEGGTRIEVRSQSRVGKGDLGQNPRNIRELLAEIDTLLGE